MKLKATIEVNGIKNIVIDREHHWKKNIWPVEIPYPGSACDWSLDMPGTTHRSYKSPEAMARYVNDLITDPKRRAWMHGDTLNIVKRPVKKDPKKEALKELRAGVAMQIRSIVQSITDRFLFGINRQVKQKKAA